MGFNPFDIFGSKSADTLKAAGRQAQQQLHAAGGAAQNTFNTAGQNAQRDFTSLGSMTGQGYGNAAATAGHTLDAGTDAALPYYDQARNRFMGLGFAPDLYGGTLQQGYQALADATGANGAAGLARARALFTATPGYREGLDLAQDQATRVDNARGVAAGNTVDAAAQRAALYADQNYGNYVSRLSPFASAPAAQLAADQARANYGMQYANALAGYDIGQGQAIQNAADNRASLISGLQTGGLNLAAQLGQQGAQLAYNGATGGANALLGAEQAGTQANLQAQEKSVEAQNAANAAAWSALLGGANLGLKAFGVGGFAPGSAVAGARPNTATIFD